MTTHPSPTPSPRHRRGSTLVLGLLAAVAALGLTGPVAATVPSATVDPRAGASPGAAPSAATYRITGLELKVASDPSSGLADHDPTKNVTVACPTGKVPVGGSVRAYEQYDNSTHLTRYLSVTQTESSLLAGGRWVWNARVEESGAGTPHPWRLDVYVTCADPPPGFDLESESVPGSDDPAKAATAVCLPGRSAIGGGVAVRSLADTKQVGLTLARVDAWGGLQRGGAHAAPQGATAPWGLTTTVICANKGIEGYEIRNAISSSDPADWSDPIQGSVIFCSPGKYILSSGVALSSDADARATIGWIDSTRMTGDEGKGHEPFPTSAAWGFVLTRVVCATAERE